MTPILGKPLSEFIFIDGADAEAVAQAEEDLRQTAITQPAVIASDIAMTRLAAAYGIQPDMAMGHSVGEYGALAASGALPFVDAMEAVSARGREMTRVSFEDNGKMAAVFAPLEEIERILKTIDGYVVTANINSNGQAVIGGTSKAIDAGNRNFPESRLQRRALAGQPCFPYQDCGSGQRAVRRMLARLQDAIAAAADHLEHNRRVLSHGTGRRADRCWICWRTQIASPVQFVKGLETLYNAGARVFVEMGPKKALQGFAEDVLGASGDVVSLFTNHPKVGDIASFNQALCGLYAAGLGRGQLPRFQLSRAATVSSDCRVGREAEASSLSAA